MYEWSSKFANTMNGMRHNFADRNNRIYEGYKNILEPNTNPTLLTPRISNQVRERLNKKLIAMQEKTIEALGNCLTHYIEMSKCSNDGFFWDERSSRFSKAIVDSLEESFSRDQYPSDAEKLRLSNLHRLSIKQVSNWFTNKRNRTKYSSSYHR
ncbi:Homeobox protein HD-1 [Astathelohania contejeani]|uniref:Homeobox protein HD-1 n=1 Tax=Astathelohania contejeani TaxID=164912 RepID=A0ABQ7HVU9_9MICR|nr:Homeobox protein HD-1 [Thelohania contejeani]